MDIKGFKALLRDYNNGKLSVVIPTEIPSLTRDCSYYENLSQEVQNARDD